MVLNLLQTIIYFTLVLWVMALGFSFLLRRQQIFWGWTQRTLVALWRNCWQFIIGVALGYYLANEQFFRLSLGH